MTPARAPSRALILAGLGSIYLLWGSTYLGIRVAVSTMPPFLMSGVRYAISGLVLLALVAGLRGRRTLRLSRSQWLASGVVGALLVAVGNGGVVWGEQTETSGIAAIVVSTTPLWMALLSRLWLGERLGLATLGGLAVGFAGLLVLIGPEATHARQLFALAALVAAALGWSAGSVYAKVGDVPGDPLLASGAQMLLGGLAALAVGFVTGEHVTLAKVSTSSWIAFAYLLAFGSIIGYAIYASLLKWASIPLVSTYAYVNPVVAVALGWLLLGERLTPRSFAGAAIVIAGVALIVGAQAYRARASDRLTAPREEAVPDRVAV